MAFLKDISDFMGDVELGRNPEDGVWKKIGGFSLFFSLNQIQRVLEVG